MRNWIYGDQAPKVLEMKRHLGMPVYSINYGMEEVTEEGAAQKYRWANVTLPAGDSTYPTMVSCLINDAYNNDEMQAIINNYILDPKDKDTLAQWNEMQKFRAYAKDLAKRFRDGLITEDTDLAIE